MKSIEISSASLITDLKSRNWEVRQEAAEKLGYALSGKKAPIELIQCLNDKHEIVRIEIVEALCRIGDSAVLPYLWKCIDDKSSLVRRYVAIAIGEIGDISYVEKLENRLKLEKSINTKIGIYEALYRLGKDKYLLNLIGALNNKNYRIRCAASHALSDLVDNRYIAQLIHNIILDYSEIESTVAAKSSMTSAIASISKHLKKIKPSSRGKSSSAPRE